MADFCSQCSIEIFGKDKGDLKDKGRRPLTKEEKDNAMGWPSICEGCGYTIVDDEGKCILECCKKHGKVNKSNF